MWGLCVAVKARHFENLWLIPASPLESQHHPLKKSPWPGPTSPSPSSPWRTAPCSPTLSPRTSSTRCTTSAPSPTLTATSSTLWRTWTHSPVETIPPRTSSTLLPTWRTSRLTSRQVHYVDWSMGEFDFKHWLDWLIDFTLSGATCFPSLPSARGTNHLH